MMEIFSASLLPFPMVQARRPDSLPNICHPSSTMGTPSPACFLASLHSRLVTISFRIKFFAHHHPLTLIESYSYKRKGKRVGSQHLRYARARDRSRDTDLSFSAIRFAASLKAGSPQ